MIGWRPYLLSSLALVLVGLVVLDVVAVSRPPPAPPPCKNADGLRDAGLYAQADRAYAAVLRDDAKSACAVSGRRAVSKGQCTRLRPILAADAAEGRKALLRLLEADPKPPGDSCLWGLLAEASPTRRSADR